jgi:hypothetical protein
MKKVTQGLWVVTAKAISITLIIPILGVVKGLYAEEIDKTNGLGMYGAETFTSCYSYNSIWKSR